MAALTLVLPHCNSICASISQKDYGSITEIKIIFCIKIQHNIIVKLCATFTIKINKQYTSNSFFISTSLAHILDYISLKRQQTHNTSILITIPNSALTLILSTTFSNQPRMCVMHMQVPFTLYLRLSLREYKTIVLTMPYFVIFQLENCLMKQTISVSSIISYLLFMNQKL